MKKKFSFILLALVLCIGAFALVGCGPVKIDPSQMPQNQNEEPGQESNLIMYEYELTLSSDAPSFVAGIIKSYCGESVGVDDLLYADEGKVGFYYYSKDKSLADLKVNDIPATKTHVDKLDVWEVKLDSAAIHDTINIEANVITGFKQGVKTWKVTVNFDKPIKK